MGFDSVSLSTRTGLGSIYNQWRYAVNNKKTTDNFKTYLLSSQEHLNQLEGLFTDYGHKDETYGDTFVKESIIELKDGRLLCLDPDQAQAYILDLNEVNSHSQKYNLTVIKPEDTSVSFSEQITNLLGKITAQLGAEGITTTKDGTNIDSSLLINTLSGDAKTQYCDEMGISDTSASTDTTYTSGRLKLFAGKGISDITTDIKEHDYYLKAFEAMGVKINSDNNTFATTFDAGGASFTASFNNTLNSISKIMEKGSTASDQDKLNLLQIIRKMSTLEYELLEKLNPGFTEALNTLIGDFQSRTYLDRNGNTTGLDTTISYETVMKEKLDAMSNDASSYLSAEDRKKIDEYLGRYVCKSKTERANKYAVGTIITKEQYLSLSTQERDDYTFEEITINMIINGTYSDGTGSLNILDESKEEKEALIDKLNAAKTSMSNASSSVAYKAMSNAISNTVVHGVSNTTIDNYKKNIENKTSPDEILLAFLEASNATDGPEIIARILEDESMVEKLKTACSKKGTLSILDRRTGESKRGVLYDINGISELRSYTVENILNHLEYQTKVYYANKSDSTSAIKSNRAVNSMEDGIYKAENGDRSDKTLSNVESIKSANTGAGVTASVAASVGLSMSTIAGVSAKATGSGFWTNATGFALKGNLGQVGLNATTFGAAATTILGTGLGAAGGLWVGNKVVESNPNKYTNADGSYNNGKANWVKGLSTISGAAFGFAASAAWGWPWTAIAGGVVGTVTAIAAAIVHNVA